jgi:hypothetical protein
MPGYPLQNHASGVSIAAMHISPEGEIGIFLALLALLGSGAIMRFPTRLWIGSTMIALSIVGFFLLAFQHFEIWQMKTVPGFGMIISAAVFLGCAVWYFLPAQPKSMAVSSLAETHDQATADLPPDIAFSLYLNCRTATIPTASLPNNVLTILEITTAFGDGMIGEHTIPAGRQKLQWPPDYLNAIVFRCELTNYGEKTVFDVELPLRLTVREAVRDTKEPGRISEGVTKPSNDYIFKVAKIDSGTHRSTIFYVSNRSPNFALVIPNETATLQQLGTVGRKTVPVMYSKKPADIMSFVPFPPMK